ncbi:hypothetical protein L596_018006 [Steinernema carpocapsae]|uniref:Uncharacterized protein n=1 Tax=Steinernema carpocapsae TaxID=34508 RepID=A0A4U5N3C9_STECR|nr:hypothetical protein L596_018006 [Steinernema carpocapsae]
MASQLTFILDLEGISTGRVICACETINNIKWFICARNPPEKFLVLIQPYGNDLVLLRVECEVTVIVKDDEEEIKAKLSVSAKEFCAFRCSKVKNFVRLSFAFV